MAKRAPTRWTFFVDESGQFSEPDACVVVGGLLVEERLVGREPGKLERALRTAAPSLPWPLHTAHLNLPVTHALEARFTGPGSEGSVTARALEEKGVVLQRCLEALAAGAWPDYDDLKLLDRHLQARESREHRRWRRRVTDVRAAIGAVLEGLVAASDPPRAAVITSSESEPCEAMAHERYLPLLEDALERALRVAALHDGEHEVWMHVLSKNVLDPTIGKKIPLLKRHIGDRLTKLPPIARVRGDEVRAAR